MRTCPKAEIRGLEVKLEQHLLSSASRLTSQTPDPTYNDQITSTPPIPTFNHASMARPTASEAFYAAFHSYRSVSCSFSYLKYTTYACLTRHFQVQQDDSAVHTPGVCLFCTLIELLQPTLSKGRSRTCQFGCHYTTSTRTP